MEPETGSMDGQKHVQKNSVREDGFNSHTSCPGLSSIFNTLCAHSSKSKLRIEVVKRNTERNHGNIPTPTYNEYPHDDYLPRHNG